MSVYQQLRPDGRDWNQLRPLKVEVNPLSRSDGSVRVSLGSTSVVAAVTGPVESKMNQNRIEILIRPSNGVPLEKHRLLEDQIIRILDSIVSIPPGSTVNIYCEVLIDDGAMAAAVFNAISLALVVSGLSMSGTPLAVAQTSNGERILLDPSLPEELKYPSSPTVVVDAISGKVLGLIGNSSPSSSLFDSLAMGSAAVSEILEVARSNFRAHLASLTSPRRK